MPRPTPRSSFASRQLERLLPIEAAPHWSAWLAAVAIAAICFAFQLFSPPSASIIALQLLLAAYAVWFIGAGAGMAIAIGTVVGGAAIHHFLIAAPPRLGLEIWNGASRIISVALLGFVLSGLRRSIELERWRAATDPLTGIANKRAFEEAMASTIARAAHADEALMLVYLDLDGFKAVNDRFGHAAGNHVLATFAAGASRAMRPADLFARIGGDEFAALLIARDVADGERMARLLHQRLRAVLATTGFEVTCSSGALVMPGAIMARRAHLLEHADTLMYAAKQRGKNILHIGHGDVLDTLPGPGPDAAGPVGEVTPLRQRA